MPELGEELGRYAELKLRERKVEVIKAHACGEATMGWSSR
jgi:hypothetical protein